MKTLHTILINQFATEDAKLCKQKTVNKQPTLAEFTALQDTFDLNTT